MAGRDATERFFDEIVAANQHRIRAIARTYAPPNERQDLCQEILLQMWKGCRGFRRESATSTWVYRVALNTAITYRRKNGRRVDLRCASLDGPLPELEAPSEPAAQVQILEEFLHLLGKIDRAIFLLYLEDLRYRDISNITGLTESHVGVRINRLKTAFRERYCGGTVWNSKVTSRFG
ncbi:MAG: sigma-70 family RNA polymerase sigma factor [Acidobacteriota bacterium]